MPTNCLIDSSPSVTTKESAGGCLTLAAIKNHLSGNKAAASQAATPQQMSGSSLKFPSVPSSPARIKAGKVSANSTASPASIDKRHFLPPAPCIQGHAAPRMDQLAAQGGYRVISVLSLVATLIKAINTTLVPDVLSGWPTASTQNGFNLYPKPQKQVASLEDSIRKQRLWRASSLRTQQGRTTGQQEHHPAASTLSCLQPCPTPHPPGNGRAARVIAIQLAFNCRHASARRLRHRSGQSVTFRCYKRIPNTF